MAEGQYTGRNALIRAIDTTRYAVSTIWSGPRNTDSGFWRGRGEEVSSCIQEFSEQLRCEIIELNVQVEYVRPLAMIPPKVAVSEFEGTVNGRTAIRFFNRFQHLERKP